MKLDLKSCKTKALWSVGCEGVGKVEQRADAFWPHSSDYTVLVTGNASPHPCVSCVLSPLERAVPSTLQETPESLITFCLLLQSIFKTNFLLNSKIM